MLPNRVDPWGNIISTAARGHWMGNRGVLHDDGKEILRPFKLKAWLICLLEFNGRKRPVMAPNRYTELFFLDEATAFATGHRPCFECRRKDFLRFKDCWLKGNPGFHFSEKTAVQEIDNILHRERIDRKGNKIIHEESPERLPDGVFVVYNHHAYALVNGLLFPWSPPGYGKPEKLPRIKTIGVLTPASTVNAFRAGYQPQVGIAI